MLHHLGNDCFQSISRVRNQHTTSAPPLDSALSTSIHDKHHDGGSHKKDAQDYFQVCMGLGGHPCCHGLKYGKLHVLGVVVVFCSSLLMLLAFLFQSTHPFSLSVFTFCSTQINLNNRCDQHWPWAISMVVDGTNCPIHEPGNFDKAWFSHKTNGPGV